jgi:formylglycine-generating enzyme required for sulfatase activity
MSSSNPAFDPPLNLFEEALAGWLGVASPPVNNVALSQWLAQRPETDLTSHRSRRPSPANYQNSLQRAPFVLVEARRRLAGDAQYSENGTNGLSARERHWLQKITAFLPQSETDDEVRRTINTNLRGLESYLSSQNDGKHRFPDYAEQAAHLVSGMAHGVLAAFHLQQEAWSPARGTEPISSDNPLPPGFVFHAANCFQTYHAAWPLHAAPMRLSKGSSFRPQPNDTRVSAAVKELFGNASYRKQVGSLVTVSDVLTLHRVLSWLLGEASEIEPLPGTNPDGSFRVDLSLLAACGDGRGAIDRGTVVNTESRWEGFFVDPVAMGLTLLDDRFLTALTIGWRCCHADLQLHKRKDSPPLALAISAESVGSGSYLLEGGSAGGLFACGMMGAAERRLLNVRDSATMSLRLTRPKSKPAEPSTDHAAPLAIPDEEADIVDESPGSPEALLDARSVFLGPVASKSLPDKLEAAGNGIPKLHPQPLRTVLVASGQTYGENREPWPAWRDNPGHPFGHLTILGVHTLAEAYSLLKGDAEIEDVVLGCAKQAVDDWNDLCTGHANRVGSEDHKLDIYIEPHLKILQDGHAGGNQRDTSERPEALQGEDSARDPYSRLDGGLDQLIGKYLLEDNRWIVLTEDAGAGKTVFTWRLRARLSEWDRRPFLVVRVEGTWPHHIRTTLEDAVRPKCHHGVTAKAVIDALLEERRVVILLDALDQAGVESVERFETFLRGDTETSLAHRLRYVVTSRAYRYNEKKGNLFQSARWLLACVELFDEAQQDAYRDRWMARHADRVELWDRLIPDREAVADLVRFPVVLRMVRGILEAARPDGSDLIPFRNRGDLYWQTAEDVVQQCFKAESRSRKDVSLYKLLEAVSCLAIEMLLTTRAEHGYVVPTILIDDLKDHARTRFSSPEKWPEYESLVQEVVVSDRSLLEANDRENLSFRSLKMLEFFAGVYLARFARDRWRTRVSTEGAYLSDAERQTSHENFRAELTPFVGSEQWYWPWRFAIELPEMQTRDGAPVHNDLALGQSLGALLRRPENFARPNELIWRAWPWLLQQAGVFRPPPPLSRINDYPQTACEKWSPIYEELLDRATHHVQSAAWDAVEEICTSLPYQDGDARCELYFDGTLDEACRSAFRRLVAPDAGKSHNLRQRNDVDPPLTARDHAANALYCFLSEYPLILQGLPVVNTAGVRSHKADSPGQVFQPPNDAAVRRLAKEFQDGYRRCPSLDDAKWAQLVSDVAAARDRGENVIHPFLRCWRGDDSGYKSTWLHDSPVHVAQLESPLLLHQFPMTNDVYALFDPHHFGRSDLREDFYTDYRRRSPQAKCPVIEVDWHDSWACSLWFQARLPTEEESEFAARAQLWSEPERPPQLLYWFGITADEAANLSDDALCQRMKRNCWFRANSGGRTREIGAAGHANDWGISDASGNVWTWCRNRYATTPETHVDDGMEPDRFYPPWRASARRVCRGGSWFHDGSECLSAYRFGVDPGCRSFYHGIRLVAVQHVWDLAEERGAV